MVIVFRLIKFHTNRITSGRETQNLFSFFFRLWLARGKHVQHARKARWQPHVRSILNAVSKSINPTTNVQLLFGTHLMEVTGICRGGRTKGSDAWNR
jgi:hypothetical protein